MPIACFVKALLGIFNYKAVVIFFLVFHLTTSVTKSAEQPIKDSLTPLHQAMSKIKCFKFVKINYYNMLTKKVNYPILNETKNSVIGIWLQPHALKPVEMRCFKVKTY